MKKITIGNYFPCSNRDLSLMVACRCGTHSDTKARNACTAWNVYTLWAPSAHFLIMVTEILSCQVCLKPKHMDLVNTQWSDFQVQRELCINGAHYLKEQWFSTFIMLGPFNTVPPLLLLPHNCNCATVDESQCFPMVLGNHCEGGHSVPKGVSPYRLRTTAVENPSGNLH